MATFNVVHVEDSPDDAELIARALTRAGIQAAIERVDTEAAYVAQLDARLPDVILCDYDMPRFSAERALEIMRVRGLDIPFIVVSNHIGQSAPVIAMQSGASDYLSKRDLGRLAKAIEAAVDRASARRERARAEQALRESEATLRGILESLDSRIALLDRQGRILATNAAWERFDPSRLAAGYPAARVGDNYLDVLERAASAGQPFSAAGAAEVRAVINREKPVASVDYQFETPGGRTWFVARITPLEGGEGGVVVAHQDITDRMMAHAAIEAAHARLQTLSKRVLSIQEEERRAIAGELHDDVGQSLAALKIGLHRMRQASEGENRLLDECIATADLVIGQLRDMAQELRPPQLDQLGLADALRWLVERHARTTGIEIECEFSGAGERRQPPALEAACYRIAQEAINNATRHARPRKIRVCVEGDSNLLRLAVHDDGSGFDQAAARQRAVKGGSLGLVSMEERAALAGGRFSVHSSPGAGTTISALFPLKADA
jgi:signal transduction histidine kinase/CheY-like chemotaxis protein